jgi:hypothetical protein
VIQMRKQKMSAGTKVTRILAAVALVLCISTIGSASALEEQIQINSQNYGNSDSPLKYNRNGLTPLGQMEQVRANQNYQFNYRNLTLTLNCTRNCELEVTLDPVLKPKALTLSIEPNQNMSLTINMSGAPPQAEMVRTQTLNFYLGLEPNAPLQLHAQIRLYINQTELNKELNREINASRLTWQYYDTAERTWVTAPSWIQNNYLVCNTTHFSTWTVALQGTSLGEPSGSGNYTEIPDVPDNAVQYNKTDTTPTGENHQVQAGEPALFQYRNMTLLMNCTQNCSVSLSADPEVTPKTLGLTVDPIQNMTLSMNMSRSPFECAEIMERSLNFYLGIEPNAELQLKAQIRLLINQTELNQELDREVNASRLTWVYWNQTQAQWMPVASFMDQNGYLVCNTDHFSTWTIAETAAQTSTQPEASPTAQVFPTRNPLVSNSPTQTSPTLEKTSPEAVPTPSGEPTSMPNSAEQKSQPAEYIYLAVVAVIIVVALGIVAFKKGRHKASI